jgi:cell division protein FtsI (penicillin-binding protein 3)
MTLRQSLLVLALATSACASPKPASPPATTLTTAVEEPSWPDAVASEADRLAKAFPEATVRIAVLDVKSGELLATHGPVGEPHQVGSTIKSFTIAAALEAGAESSTELDTGDGTTTFGTLAVQDHTGHGKITVEQALMRSSNVAIVRLVEKLGEDELYRRVAGVLPLPQRSSLDDAAALMVLFGGRLTLSTEQLARGYAVLAAGGVDPRNGARLVEADVADEVLRILERAVTAPEGTGNGAAVEGRKVAGKTGTASSGDRNTALFVGITEDRGRELIVAVVVDGVPSTETGSTVAAPAFARILQGAT